MKLTQLADECARRGLPKNGTKVALLERLNKYEADKIDDFSDFDAPFRESLGQVDVANIGELAGDVRRIPRVVLAYSKAAPTDPASRQQQDQAILEAFDRIRVSLAINKRPKKSKQPSAQAAIVAQYQSIVAAIVNKPPPAEAVGALRELLEELDAARAGSPAAGTAPSGGNGLDLLKALPQPLLASLVAAAQSGQLTSLLQPGGPPAVPSASETAARALRSAAITTKIKSAVLEAFAPPPSGAGSLSRPITQERTIAQALVAGFREPGFVLETPGTEPETIRLRRAVHSVILEVCLDTKANDDAISLLSAYLLACAHVALDSSDPDTVACSWYDFVANSVVGDSATNSLTPLERGLATFRTVGWLTTTAPRNLAAGTGVTRGPTVMLSEDAHQPAQVQATAMAAPTGTAPLKRESPLEGKQGKAMLEFVKSMSTSNEFSWGPRLVYGGSEFGARIAAAHNSLTNARNPTAGARTIDLIDIPFGGYSRLPYEVTRVADWAMASLRDQNQIIRTALENGGALVDAITGVHFSTIANVLMANIRKGGRIGFSMIDGVPLADSTSTEDLPDGINAFLPWWRRHVTEEVPIFIYRMVQSKERNPGIVAIPPGAVHPDVAFSKFIGDAINHVLEQLAARFPGVSEAWLISLPFQWFLLDGVAHCRLHPDLEACVDPLASAAAAATTLASFPHWYNYRTLRGVTVPSSWPKGASQTLETGRSDVAALAPASSVATVAGPKRGRDDKRGRDRGRLSLRAEPVAPATALPLPWIVRNPHEKRSRETCLYCGPPQSHNLRDCTAYTAFLRTAAGSPYKASLTIGRLPLGQSYSESQKTPQVN